MKITSIIAIYGLFWVMAAFIVLPFGVRTHDELGTAKVPGQADSAPGNFDPRKISIRATILATAMFAFFYANYFHGWITVADLDLTTYFPH
jgi:predicted secreted protein